MNIESVPIAGPILDGLKKMFQSPERQFKDKLDALLKQAGVDDETRERLRDVLDTGRDEDLTLKLDQLSKGELTDKNGNPIELIGADGEPVALGRDVIGQLAQSCKVPKSSIDPSLIGNDPWESYGTTVGSSAGQNWMTG